MHDVGKNRKSLGKRQSVLYSDLCMKERLRVLLQDEDIVSEESLREVCQKVGLSGELTDNLIGQIRTERIKEELKRTTQEALDLGVSGPTPGERGNSFLTRHSPLIRKRVSSPNSWNGMGLNIVFLLAGIWCSLHCGSHGWWQERSIFWQWQIRAPCRYDRYCNAISGSLLPCCWMLPRAHWAAVALFPDSPQPSPQWKIKAGLFIVGWEERLRLLNVSVYLSFSAFGLHQLLQLLQAGDMRTWEWGYIAECSPGNTESSLIYWGAGLGRDYSWRIFYMRARPLLLDSNQFYCRERNKNDCVLSKHWMSLKCDLLLSATANNQTCIGVAWRDWYVVTSFLFQF